MVFLAVVVFNNYTTKQEQTNYFKSFLKVCLSLESVIIIMLHQIHPSMFPSYTEDFMDPNWGTDLVSKGRQRRKAEDLHRPIRQQ